MSFDLLSQNPKYRLYMLSSAKFDYVMLGMTVFGVLTQKVRI